MPKFFNLLLHSTLLILLFSGCQSTLPSDSNVTIASDVQALPKETPVEIESIAPISEKVAENQVIDDSYVFRNDQLTVQKTLLKPNQVGGNLLYEISITVLKDIEHLTIEDRLPKNLLLYETTPKCSLSGNQLIWHFHALKKGSTEQILVQVTPKVEGDYTIPTTVRLEQEIDLNLFAGQPDLNIQLAGPPTIELNDEGTWEIIVTNQGSAIANDVALNALFSNAFETENTSYSLQSLPVGASKSFTFEASAIKQGLFENQFKASYKNSVPEREGFANASTRVVQSKIRVQKIGPKSAYVFKPESYKIQIFNTGDTDLKNVRITDIFAENYSVIETGNGRLSENAIGWVIPFLPAGSKQVIETKMTSNKPGKAMVKTLLKTANGLEATDQMTTQWLAVPGVTISIIDAKDPITIGDNSEYTIQVKNQGEFEPVSGTITIEFSEHLKPTAILNNMSGSIIDNKIKIPEVLLKPGKDITLNVSAQGVKAGSGRANLNFMADFLVNPVISQESTNIY